VTTTALHRRVRNNYNPHLIELIFCCRCPDLGTWSGSCIAFCFTWGGVPCVDAFLCANGEQMVVVGGAFVGINPRCESSSSAQGSPPCRCIRRSTFDLMVQLGRDCCFRNDISDDGRNSIAPGGHARARGAAFGRTCTLHATPLHIGEQRLRVLLRRYLSYYVPSVMHSRRLTLLGFALSWLGVGRAKQTPHVSRIKSAWSYCHSRRASMARWALSSSRRHSFSCLAFSVLVKIGFLSFAALYALSLGQRNLPCLRSDLRPIHPFS
jgi:hypothetical protein